MEEEMRMVATQDIQIGQDLTSPIPPLSYFSSSVLTALHLLSSSFAHSPGYNRRLHGLLTNHDKLMSLNDEMTEWIRDGAKQIASAKRQGNGMEVMSKDVVLVEEEEALCAVVTNGVEVMDSEGKGLGVAVYGWEFSWINHSCAPNACYRFAFSSEEVGGESTTRIAPSGGPIQVSKD